MTTCGNGNVQSHDQEEHKLDSTINAALTDDKIIKSQSNKNKENHLL